MIPLAEGEKDQRIREADGYRLKRINEAEGDVARFGALFERTDEIDCAQDVIGQDAESGLGRILTASIE